MRFLGYFPLLWVAFCTAAWLIIRRKRPEWIGLGTDFNKQKIDGVRYESCPKCTDGRLQPIFHSLEKRNTITIPPGLIYVVGTPDEYKCTHCGYAAPRNLFKRRFTRISLAHRLPEGEATKILLKFGILVGLLALMVFLVDRWIY
jgi:hypothetical protein